MAHILKYALIIFVLSSFTGCVSTSASENSPMDNKKAAEINVSLGLNYMRSGEYQIAMDKLKKALRQDPQSASAHNTIAILYQILKETDEANTHFSKAVSLAPSFSDAQNNYGVFLCQQGKYKEAEKRFLLAIKNPLYSSPAQAYENAGLCANSVPNIVKAEYYFDQALQVSPQLPTSILELAKINYQQAKYEKSRAFIKKYQLLAEWSPQTLLLAIQIEKGLGNTDAIASYALLLRARFPTSDEAEQVQKGQY